MLVPRARVARKEERSACSQQSPNAPTWRCSARNSPIFLMQPPAGTTAGAVWPDPPKYWKDPLRAPPKPPDGPFQMFGVQRPAIGSVPPLPPLEEQLYSAANEREALVELRRLNKLLLTSFLDLLRAMQETPTQCSAKVAQIRTLLLNIQHLLNSLRPFQAREELISTLQAQLDAKQELVDELRSGIEAAATSVELDDSQEPDSAFMIKHGTADATGDGGGEIAPPMPQSEAIKILQKES